MFSTIEKDGKKKIIVLCGNSGSGKSLFGKHFIRILWEKYKDNIENGLSKSWYENGQMEKEASFKNGKLDGKSILWYKNGQKKSEAVYKDDYLNGKVTYWY